MIDDSNLARQLSALNTQQLGFVAGKLLDHLTADAPIPDEDPDHDENAESMLDAALVESAADQLVIAQPAGEDGDLATMLAAAAVTSPDARTVIVDALARIDEPGVRLGPVTFAVAALALAIAGAILRPKVVSEAERNVKDGSEKTRFVFEFQGIPNIAAVVKAALPFLM